LFGPNNISRKLQRHYIHCQMLNCFVTHTLMMFSRDYIIRASCVSKPASSHTEHLHHFNHLWRNVNPWCLVTSCSARTLLLDAQEVKKALRKAPPTPAQTKSDTNSREAPPSSCQENNASNIGPSPAESPAPADSPAPSVGNSPPVPAPRMKRRKNGAHRQSASNLSASTASLNDDTKKNTTPAVVTEMEKTPSEAGTVDRTATSDDSSLMERTCSDVSLGREEEGETTSERETASERQSEGDTGVCKVFCLACRHAKGQSCCCLSGLTPCTRLRHVTSCC